jgi:hypothetical protein
MKEELIKILKESGSLELNVHDDGYVDVVFKIDGEEILKTETIDLVEEVEQAKSARESRAWV